MQELFLTWDHEDLTQRAKVKRLLWKQCYVCCIYSNLDSSLSEDSCNFQQLVERWILSPMGKEIREWSTSNHVTISGLLQRLQRTCNLVCARRKRLTKLCEFFELKAARILVVLMCKHDYDARYQKLEDKLYIAQLYFPLIGLVRCNLFQSEGYWWWTAMTASFWLLSVIPRFYLRPYCNVCPTLNHLNRFLTACNTGYNLQILDEMPVFYNLSSTEKREVLVCVMQIIRHLDDATLVKAWQHSVARTRLFFKLLEECLGLFEVTAT